MFLNQVFTEGFFSSNEIFNHYFLVDSFGIILKSILVFIILFLLILGRDSFVHFKLHSFDFFLLFLLSIFGLLFILNSFHFIPLYIAIELQSLCFYVLTSMRKNYVYSIEAGLKYFIIGSFSSCVLLFGISFLYGFTGFLGFGDLSLFLNNIFYNDLFFLIGITFSILLISLGFCFKLYVAPFHWWIQDIYQYAIPFVTFFFALVPSYVVLSSMARVYFNVFDVYAWEWEFIFSLCGFLSILLGSIGGLYQKKIRRLVAYSSINNFGYLLVLFTYMDYFTLTNMYIYYIVYIFNNIIVFLFIFSILKKNTFFSSTLDNIDDFKGYGFYNKIVSLFLIIGLFSLAGIPPMSGFYTKFFVFFHLYNHSNYFVLFFIILTSLFSCFYYLRIVSLMYFKGFNFDIFYTHPSFLNSLSFYWCCFFTVSFIYISSYFSVLCEWISLSLLY
jgi:NADH-quinone oxidoreductase subunit N